MKAIAVLAAACLAIPAAQAKDDASVKRGRYIVRIGDCKDCHTAGFAPSSGKVPQSRWLRGDALGWRGPWGTTYPANLRLYMQDLTEAQWVPGAA
jgi:mono/diheme cytochrome c family protein